MRPGRFFPIPENPRDLRRLWSEAPPLSPAELPPWLDATDAPWYRCLGEIPCDGLDAAQRAALDAECETLELARLIVEEEASPSRRRVYLSNFGPQQVWSIGTCRGPDPLHLAAGWLPNPVLTAEQVTDVPAAFVADPFLVRGAQGWWMFFEVFNWQSRKGEIGLAGSRDGADWTYRQIVLSEAHHLSYPYVFAAGGQYWMIPETHQANSVRLYRAAGFPTRWEFHAELLTGQPFADASIVHHDGRWWLFAETSGDRHDTLRLYHSPALSGPWREHPQSPVVRGDPTIARPAGRLLATPQGLLRVAQNCREEYGVEVRAMRITALDPEHYAERPLQPQPILGPSGAGWNACGMHHVDAVPLDDGNWLAAVDGWTRE